MATLIVLGLVAFFALAGWARGGTQIAGLVLGTILAILLAPRLGHLVETPVGNLFSTGGLAARFIAIALLGLAIITITTIGLWLAIRRWAKSDERVRHWDKRVGVGIGALEGLLVALLLLWVPLALEPVARARIAASAEHATEPGDAPAAHARGRHGAPDALSAGIVGAAERIRGSAVGGLAAATNPVAGSEIMHLAEDFAAISQDQAAMERFLQTDVMKRIQALESVNKAIDMLERDPELRRFSDGEGVTVAGLMRILENRTILKVLDTTSVVSDLTPMAADLQAAIQRSKAPPRSGPAPPPRPAAGP